MLRELNVIYLLESSDAALRSTPAFHTALFCIEVEAANRHVNNPSLHDLLYCHRDFCCCWFARLGEWEKCIKI